MVLRVMIDTMIYDALVKNSKLRLLVKVMQDNRVITLTSTRIQEDQLADIPPVRDVGQKSIVQTTRVSPAVFILGFSVLGEDRLGSDEANAAFDHLQDRKLNHTKDAMIGATAFNDADILVTNDKRFVRRFAAMAGMTKVMTEAEFQAFLMTLT